MKTSPSVLHYFIRYLSLLTTCFFLLTACSGSGSSDSKIDKIKPVITILGNNPVTLKKGDKYSEAGATAIDNIDGKIRVTSTGEVNTSMVATYIITYEARDKAGNKATATRKVIIQKDGAIDNAPVITILGKNPVSIQQGSIYKDAGATALDDIDGKVAVTKKGSVNTNKVATYSIIYSAKDKAGNISTATRKIIVKEKVVQDKIPPVITLKGSSTMEIVQGSIFQDPSATAKDNVDGTVNVTRTGTVNTSKIGTYTLTYHAEDKAGNKARKTRKVTVKAKVVLDTVPPVITIIGANPFEINQGETFSDPGATAKDDIDGVVSVTPSSTVNMDESGEYKVTYTAGDKAGNTETVVRKVIVKSASVVWRVSTVAEFRQALEDAAANGAHDRIILTKGVYKTSSDNLGAFTFSDDESFDLTIESDKGLTHIDVTLDGDNTHRVFNFLSKKSTNLRLKGISFINGKSASKGGGIYANRSIIIEMCNISGNNAETGGGIFSTQSISLYSSIVSSNNIDSHTARASGGGFYSNGITNIIDSTISNNTAKGRYGIASGGGFYSEGNVIIRKSTIANNTTTSNGGGFDTFGDVTIVNSTINDNHSIYSGAGFHSYHDAKIINSEIYSNNTSYAGGAGFAISGRAIVISSTMSNNKSASLSGGFYAGKTAIVINSIFNSNKATNGGSFSSGSRGKHYSYIVNSLFINNDTPIYSSGYFVNNIFHPNDAGIYLVKKSKIYNSYIDYNKVFENAHNVIKKHNLQPTSVGDAYLNNDNKTLASNSPVIDKGLNPSSATFKSLIDNEDVYKELIELLKVDIDGNKRIHNGTIDMGAAEYGSSK